MQTKPAIEEAHRRMVREIVQAVIPEGEFRVFGSRATGRARPFSDLDLLILRPRRLTWDQRASLSDAFEASDLPYCVDIVEAGALPAAMAERVLQEMVPI